MYPQVYKCGGTPIDETTGGCLNTFISVGYLVVRCIFRFFFVQFFKILNIITISFVFCVVVGDIAAVVVVVGFSLFCFGSTYSIHLSVLCVCVSIHVSVRPCSVRLYVSASDYFGFLQGLSLDWLRIIRHLVFGFIQHLLLLLYLKLMFYVVVISIQPVVIIGL